MSYREKFNTFKLNVVEEITQLLEKKEEFGGDFKIREEYGDILVEADDGNLYPIHGICLEEDWMVYIQLDHPESENKQEVEELGYLYELKIEELIALADSLNKTNN